MGIMDTQHMTYKLPLGEARERQGPACKHWPVRFWLRPHMWELGTRFQGVHNVATCVLLPGRFLRTLAARVRWNRTSRHSQTVFKEWLLMQE